MDIKMDIEIDITDERHFTDVAPVVDREDFAKEVDRIRSVLKIKTPLSENDFSKTLTQQEEEAIKAEIEKSRKRLYLPVIFRRVIEAVVFRNKVTDEDYSPAYLEHHLDIFDPNNEALTPDETYSIVLSPGARDVDVLKAYQKYRDQLGNIKGVPKYKYIHQIWDISKNKPSLKKHREWYLLATNSGNTFKEIADMETKNCPLSYGHPTGENKAKNCICYDESTIRKGFNAYESLIWKTRTL